MVRRLGVLSLLSTFGLLLVAPAAWAHLESEPAQAAAGSPTTTTATTATDELPGTTLEAEERDDGSNAAAPWLIGSAIAAVLAIAIGGTLLKRRVDREKAEASGDGAGGDGSGSDGR
jgi:hypothetical protein